MQNIFLIGMMGSGKTTIAKLLSKELSINYFDIDEEIEKIMEMSIQKIFNEYGEERFRLIESSFFNEMANVNTAIYATGGGIVESKINQQTLKNNGFTIFLDCSIEELKRRISKENNSRPLLKNNIDDNLNVIYQKRKNAYQDSADLIISVDNYSKKEIIQLISEKIDV